MTKLSAYEKQFKELEMKGKVNKPYSSSDLSNIEKKLGIKLPASYLYFIDLFGSGSLCDFFTIFFPCGDTPNLDFISKLDSLMNSVSRWIPSLIGKVIPFGKTDNGNILCWDITSKRKGEYPILILDSGSFNETILPIATDLYDFVNNFCLAQKIDELFPIGQCHKWELKPVFIPYTAMPTVLITGPPGSGKTHISTKLKCMGLNAWDADTVNGLCKWVDSIGNDANFPENATREWLDSHNFIWDKTFLQEWLHKNKGALLFGSSSNIFDMIPLFDKAYYLDLTENELRKRLDNPERMNPMGKSEEQKRHIFERMQRGKQKALKAEMSLINATKSPQEIIDIIHNT